MRLVDGGSHYGRVEVSLGNDTIYMTAQPVSTSWCMICCILYKVDCGVPFATIIGTLPMLQ